MIALGGGSCSALSVWTLRFLAELDDSEASGVPNEEEPPAGLDNGDWTSPDSMYSSFETDSIDPFDEWVLLRNSFDGSTTVAVAKEAV